MPFAALQKSATAQQNAWPYPVSWTQPPVELAADQFLLKLTGLTGESITMTLKDLDLLPQKSLSRRWINHNGWTVRCEWQGVLLQHLMEKLRPPHGVPLFIQQTNASGAKEAIPMKEMMLHRPILVRAVNGQPLLPLFGGPLSVMCFHSYSYKGLPHVTELALTETPVNTVSAGLGLPDSGTIQPGNYFTWDMGVMQPIKRATEVDDY
jgi:DMSO/TMAO reductase YedYZ molybdopterin-dependent catalytic subunit